MGAGAEQSAARPPPAAAYLFYYRLPVLFSKITAALYEMTIMASHEINNIAFIEFSLLISFL